MEEKEEQQKKMNIALSADVASGTYVNIAAVAHSQHEFVLDFISALPGMQPTVKSRVIMTPGNVKHLLALLAQNVENYEQKHGKISDPQQQQQGLTIPFGFGGNKGNA